MSEPPPTLVLPAGDVHAALAGRRPARLEITPGVVRRVGAGGAQTWDVTGCRLQPVAGDFLGVNAAHAFVDPSGEVRCWTDLAEWMPGVLRSDPVARAAERGDWLRRVAEAVAAAAGVQRQSRSLPEAGPRISAAEEAVVRRAAVGQLLALVLTVGLTLLGLRFADDRLVLAGGTAGVVLALLTTVPRAWWPRRRVAASWRVRLAGPAAAPRAELAGRDGDLVHTTADGVRRVVPLDGPTAPLRACTAPGGRVVLEFPGALVDVSPRSEADAGPLSERLRAAGIRVEEVPGPPAVPGMPLAPSGSIGDARWSAGAGVAVALTFFAGFAAYAGASPTAMLPLVAGIALALAGGLRAWLTDRALRRGPGRP